MLGLAAGAYFAFLAPKPAPHDPAPARRLQAKVQKEAAGLRLPTRLAEDDVKRRTWNLPPERLGTRVMDDVARVAENRRLTVANFQAGRVVDGAGLRQLAFNVTLEGAFPDVLAAVGDLERPEARLAVSGMNVAPQNAEGTEPGRVSATVGLTAFVVHKEDE